MARDLFPGTLAQLPNGDPAVAAPFTVWDDLTSGLNVTASLRAADGVSSYTATTDAQGLVVPFRGPDGEPGPLFVDTGLGQRFMLLSSTAQARLFNDIASMTASAIGAVQNAGGFDRVWGRTSAQGLPSLTESQDGDWAVVEVG